MEYSVVEKLRELRKSNNITQEQLAEMLDVSRSKVSSWETKRRDMSITEAVKLAAVYEASLDNIFGNENISSSQYAEISDKFIRNEAITLDEKIRIIELIRKSLQEKNIDKFYNEYIMTQNATKH